MTEKRLAALFLCFLVLFSLVLGRCYLVASNEQYAAAAQEQTVATITADQTRGNFYDRNGQPLTGGATNYEALCLPGDSSYSKLFDLVSEESQNILYQRRNSVTPFFIQVPEDLSDQGFFVCTCQDRYWSCPVATHLLGYLDGEGRGVSGLEQAFDSLLAESGDTRIVRCATTAQGRLMEEEQPMLSTLSGTHQGVILTLDGPLQRACEAIAQNDMTSGCILVMERESGRVLACVSKPEFDPDNLAASLSDENGALLNRALCQYNVGSVFKPLLAACALEEAVWQAAVPYQCQGYEEVDGQVYRCANGTVHGVLNMGQALAQSCNSYFIHLGMELGGEKILALARDLGLGQALTVAPGMESAGGNLPQASTLENTGQLANFSFGQGELMATPVQIAAFLNTIANEGEYVAPAFVEGILDEDTGLLQEQIYQKQSRKVLKDQTAELLSQMLIGVVEEGIGQAARPPEGGAGGKTGTAQTGSYTEDGTEKMNLWFGGFFPAEEPKYTIVVLQDFQVQPASSSALIFSRVCSALIDLEMS